MHNKEQRTATDPVFKWFKWKVWRDERCIHQRVGPTFHWAGQDGDSITREWTDNEGIVQREVFMEFKSNLPDDIEKLIEDYRDAVYGDAVFDHLKDGGKTEEEVNQALRARIAEIVAENEKLRRELESAYEYADAAEAVAKNHEAEIDRLRAASITIRPGTPPPLIWDIFEETSDE